MVEFIKSKKEMSEEDIKANFITPAIVSKGWKNGEHIAYEEYFTDGRIEVIRNSENPKFYSAIHCLTPKLENMPGVIY
ncbi:TPA: hypothetical protein V0V11_002146 [Streptococcus pneumoniae]|nr:hypothetical protein [Streptococcus pneumoniae]